ncbi:sugar ABC transporter substrate-binding protein [Neobacillus sp. DY30]|uniref:ABC transporter substrate-binding protein n=1 Tax=Neobacillus sp. DY30 TaxID=3047871 RepID=UPI0024C0AD2D|nr:sugar ABC transporter substrate-binding protein [Neobacillus sp. DY30]WHY00904.1 sugar ABC transporter substrate-binding protein [Neobacillus sp. DY30]
MRKFISLLMVALFVFVLAACSNSASNNQETEKGTNELKVWVHVPEDEPEGANYDARAKEFEEQHEGVKVTVEHIVKTGEGSGYNDRINAAITTGELPDVVTLESVHTASYADSDILLPLNDYLDQSTIDSYLDTIISAGSVGDNLYALQSFDLSAPVFYNPNIFKAAGIEIPADENGNWTLDLAWSYEEFLENTRILKEHMGKEPVHMFPDNSGWQMYAHSPIIFANDGKLVGENGLDTDGFLNSKNTMEALRFMETLFREGIVSPTARENAFALGNAAISFEGPWMIDVFTKDYPDLNWSIMPYPYGKEGHNSAPHGSWYVAGTKNTKYPELTAELVAHLTNKESAKAMEEAAGLIPGHKELLDSSELYSTYPRKLMLDQLVNTEHLKPKSPIFPVLEDVLGDIVEGIALESGSLEDLVQDAIDKAEREATRYK